jgi:hypothetical protein
MSTVAVTRIVPLIALLAAAVAASAQAGGGGETKVIVNEKPLSPRPLWSFRAEPTLINTTSGTLFEEKVIISDKDEWEFEYSDRSKEVKIECNNAHHVMPRITSGTQLQEVGLAHDSATCTFTRNFGIVAMTLPKGTKWVGQDIYFIRDAPVHAVHSDGVTKVVVNVMVSGPPITEDE